MTRAIAAAADWGTSSFRLWLLGEDGSVLAERRSTDGLMVARERGFAAVLEGHLSAMEAPDGLPVVACGMVGARSGWIEAPYRETPVHLTALSRGASRVPHEARPVYILPGVTQRGAAPDVMRGEETKLLALGAKGDGIVILPGTQTRWARLDGGSLAGFSTFMTGEVFAGLRSGERSVLAEVLAGAAEVSADDPAFRAAVGAAVAAPELTTNRIFGLRAAFLVEGALPTTLLARLSGLLIGLEIAGARTVHGDLAGATLIASGPAASLYEAALTAVGAPVARRLEGDDAVLAGLRNAVDLILNEGKGPEA